MNPPQSISVLRNKHPLCHRPRIDSVGEIEQAPACRLNVCQNARAIDQHRLSIWRGLGELVPFLFGGACRRRDLLRMIFLANIDAVDAVD
jgi:hypothetical protein